MNEPLDLNQPAQIKPFRVALTGGIASGKSTVANMFADLGITIIDTDIVAREVVEPGQPALDEIRARFGSDVIDAAGRLDRRALRKRIFADNNARIDLEEILHPRIGAETKRQADVATGPYQVIVVPLLVDSPLREFVDRIIVVDCSEAQQIERLLARDAETVEQARKILAAQSSRTERLSIADYVVSNDDGLEETLRQVQELHQRLLDLADRRSS